MKHLSFILIVTLSFLPNLNSQTYYGPYGGGRNYELIPVMPTATITSSDFITIKSIIENASQNEVIFIDIPDNKIIEVTETLTIPSGVAVFGMRGVDDKKGAKFKSNHSSNTAIILESDSRITGIRLVGPVTSRESHVYVYNTGISVENSNNIIIDNCEISHWTVGISVDTKSDYPGILDKIKIHNNFIHHNMSNSVGYGIFVGDKSYLEVNNNIFDYNRHDIAGGGYPLSGYSISKNLFLPNRTTPIIHSIDMHGCSRSPNCVPKYQQEGGCYAAGGLIEIKNNHFISYPIEEGNRRYPSIAFGGIPLEGATISNNYFTRPFLAGTWSHPEYQVVNQFHTGDNVQNCCLDLGLGYIQIPVIQNGTNEGNVTLSNNHYDQEGLLKIIFVSWGGITPWKIIRPYDNEQFLVGDFNGDGKSDFFKGDGKFWWISWGGVSEWVKLPGSSYKRTEQLFVKDWNRDGFDDLVFKWGSNYSISYFNAQGNYYTGVDYNNTNGAIIADFPIMNFDSDNLPDYFETTGTEWYVTFSTTGTRTRINGFSELKESLIFGDLDGDGITDVIKVGDAPLYEGDFDGDGYPDLSNTATKSVLNKNEFNNENKLSENLSASDKKELNNPRLEVNPENISSIYPNPTNDILYMPKNLFIKSIEIYEINGKFIKSIVQGIEQNYICVDWLKKGTYLLKIKSSNNEFSVKILKN